MSVPAPQKPTFAPTFTGSLAGNARPVRRSEQFRSYRRCRAWRARSAGLCGARRSLSIVCARKNRCTLPPLPALLGASARTAVLAGFSVLGVGYSVLFSPSAMQPHMGSSSNRTLHPDAREAAFRMEPSQPRAGERERYSAKISLAHLAG